MSNAESLGSLWRRPPIRFNDTGKTGDEYVVYVSTVTHISPKYDLPPSLNKTSKTKISPLKLGASLVTFHQLKRLVPRTLILALRWQR